MSDIDNVIAALNLEYGANRRYAYQIDGSPFADLNRILEGVRRTEGDHIEAMIEYLKAQHQADPKVGRGFATMLTHLKLNLAFETSALDAYAKFARESDDPDLKQTFQRLSHSEAGHKNLFTRLIAQIEANEYSVRVYCPVCGWEIDFGTNPPDDTVVKCEQCKQRVGLTLIDGDFSPVAVPRAECSA